MTPITRGNSFKIFNNVIEKVQLTYYTYQRASLKKNNGDICNKLLKNGIKFTTIINFSEEKHDDATDDTKGGTVINSATINYSS